MTTKVTWSRDMVFDGKNEAGLTVRMDSNPEFGGKNQGPSPMELQLLALGGCSAMDVVSLFKKMRQDVTGFEISLDGERATEHPKVFTTINMVFHVTGRHLDPAMIEKAIRLSHDKYCSVAGMLKKTCEINLLWKIYPA